MTAFLDTSVFVAAFLEQHPHHPASFPLLRDAQPKTTFCSTHALAEVFATVTAVPARYRMAPDHAWLCVEEIRRLCTVVALDEQDYTAALQKAALRGFRSGMIYDALHLRCAEKAGAGVIYTWNVKDFQKLSPEHAARIRTP